MYRTRSLLLRWNLDLDFVVVVVFVVWCLFVSAFISLSYAFTLYVCRLRKQYSCLCGTSEFGFERMWNVICIIPLANSSQSLFNVVSFACAFFFNSIDVCYFFFSDGRSLFISIVADSIAAAFISINFFYIINTQMGCHVYVHLFRFANEKS